MYREKTLMATVPSQSAKCHVSRVGSCAFVSVIRVRALNFANIAKIAKMRMWESPRSLKAHRNHCLFVRMRVRPSVRNAFSRRAMIRRRAAYFVDTRLLVENSISFRENVSVSRMLESLEI